MPLGERLEDIGGGKMTTGSFIYTTTERPSSLVGADFQCDCFRVSRVPAHILSLVLYVNLINSLIL